MGRPSGRPGPGARLYAVVSHRRLQRVYDGAADPLWAVGAACTSSGYWTSSQAALDAAPAVALCAGGQDRAASAPGRRAAPRGVWLAGGRLNHVLAPLGWHINTA